MRSRDADSTGYGRAALFAHSDVDLDFVSLPFGTCPEIQEPAHWPTPASSIQYTLPDRLPGIPAAVAIMIPVEVEHVEQITDRWRVDGNIGILVVDPRVGQVIAAASAELAEIPVALDKFHKGGVFAVDMGDVAAP